VGGCTQRYLVNMQFNTALETISDLCAGLAKNKEALDNVKREVRFVVYLRSGRPSVPRRFDSPLVSDTRLLHAANRRSLAQGPAVSAGA
jgi:hypothetical protein